MKQSQKNLFIVAGVICSIIGIGGGIPSFAAGNYLSAAFATILLVLGIILIALGLGD